jgi:hypothetical protein
MCNHKWKQYQGFTETYTDCELCGMKKEDYDVDLDKAFSKATTKYINNYIEYLVVNLKLLE